MTGVTMAEIEVHGYIIVGYQGIGKSTYACADHKAIDLESSNFYIDGERSDDWYAIYCKLAVSLAKQGYVVFVSSHKCVIDEFTNYNYDPSYTIVIVAPHLNLAPFWIEKLRQRYEKNKSKKNYKAWKNAEANIYETIPKLTNNGCFSCILIERETYSLNAIVDSIIKINDSNTLYTWPHITISPENLGYCKA